MVKAILGLSLLLITVSRAYALILPLDISLENIYSYGRSSESVTVGLGLGPNIRLRYWQRTQMFNVELTKRVGPLRLTLNYTDSELWGLRAYLRHSKATNLSLAYYSGDRLRLRLFHRINPTWGLVISSNFSNYHKAILSFKTDLADLLPQPVIEIIEPEKETIEWFEFESEGSE